MREERWHVLDGHELRPATLTEWSAFLDNHEARTVGLEPAGNVRVSTVFIGVDMGNGPEFGDPEPLYFETMTFADHGDPHDCYVFARYTTWDQAAAGHRKLVDMLNRGEDVWS